MDQETLANVRRLLVFIVGMTACFELAGVLGLLVAWNLPDMARNMAVYGGILLLVLLILPSQVAYEKTSEADH